jgi:hypothetical protein
MAYGYVDDELGGMESNTVNAIKVSNIIKKYNMKINTGC